MRKSKGTWLVALGTLLLAAALVLTVYNMQTELMAGESAAQVLNQLTAAGVVPAQDTVLEPQTAPAAVAESGTAAVTEVQPPDYIRFPEMEMPVVEVEGNSYLCTLRIPQLGLELPVMSDWSYPQLKIAPCRYSGSAYQNNLIVIAHNYASHFGHLKELMPGAEVTVTDMAGNVFCYAVAETEILAPHQVEALENTDYPLTLLTCTLGGQTRVTVRCEKTGEIPAE